MANHAPAERASIPMGGPPVDHMLPRRYLALAAEVAERLLGAEDPARMIDDLFELVRAELRLDVFFNYRFHDARLHLEAHGGLTPEEAAAGAVLEVGQAVCGCAARDRRRIHATGVQASEDPLVGFVRQVGLDAYACTPLVHGPDLLGTLGFGRRWVDRFTEDELSFLHTICHYVALAKYRLRVEEELRRGVAERERLLAELNHRVRNSLQIAVSLVAIDAQGAAEPAARAALERTAARLEVLAVAHRPLYGDAIATGLDVATLLRTVAEPEGSSVVATEEYTLPVEQAVALALLVRSLLLQPDKPPATIHLATAMDAGNQHLLLTLEGPMWGRNDLPPSEGRIVDVLSRQLNAQVEYVPDTHAQLRLPLGPAR